MIVLQLQWQTDSSRKCLSDGPISNDLDPQLRFQGHAIIFSETVRDTTRRALSRAHVPPIKVFPRLAVNKTI